MNRQLNADEEKKTRLAAALRENLKRRKAQARARRTGDPGSERLEAGPLPGDRHQP